MMVLVAGEFTDLNFFLRFSNAVNLNWLVKLSESGKFEPKNRPPTNRTVDSYKTLFAYAAILFDEFIFAERHFKNVKIEKIRCSKF
jgi:hypothetical protein